MVGIKSAKIQNTTVLVVMGVSGSGKTSLAQQLSENLGWTFQEGDALHPQANIDKMHDGIPLTDQDREPWLLHVKDWVQQHIDNGTNGIISCSALKRSYRDKIYCPGVVFIYIPISEDILRHRLKERSNHFMPASLLDSQLATLEPPSADESSITIPLNDSLDDSVNFVLEQLNQLHKI